MTASATILNEARELLRAGRMGEAVHVVREGVRANPDDLELLESLVELYLKSGQPEQALRSASLARHGGLDSPGLRIREGEVYLQMGALQKAANQFQAIIREDDGNARAWSSLGQCLLRAGDMARAVNCFSGALKADPENVMAMHALAQCWARLRQFAQAEALYKRLLAKEPENPVYRLHYADLLGQMGRNHEARRLAEPLLKERNLAPAARRVLIPIYLHDAEPDAAARLCREGLEAEPKEPKLELWLGRALHLSGEREQAEKLLSRLCGRGDAPPAAWSYLVNAREDGLSEQEVIRARAAIRNTREPLPRTLVHFALAEHFQNRGDHDAEFAEVVAGNSERLAVTDYDAARDWEQARMIMQAFDGQRIRQLSVHGQSGVRPVFLLTMPRSGSTLLERMLGAHSRMWPVGETTFVNALLQDEQQRSGVNSLELFRELEESAVKRMAGELADSLLAKAGGEAARPVEKGVSNHFIAGLLKVLLPDALFVEVKRDPLDVCTGCFRQNFANQDFSLTLEGCADAYARYETLVSHWKEQMPDSIYSIRYENLVTNTEETLRGVLEFLGEPWEDACLDYHSSEQVVATVSLNQVREKLFTQGIGRWRRYQSHLEPLFRELDRLGVAYSRN